MRTDIRRESKQMTTPPSCVQSLQYMIYHTGGRKIISLAHRCVVIMHALTSVMSCLVSRASRVTLRRTERNLDTASENLPLVVDWYAPCIRERDAEVVT